MVKITTLHVFRDDSRLLIGDCALILRKTHGRRVMEGAGIFHVSSSGRVINKFSEVVGPDFVFKMFRVLPSDGLLLIFARGLDCAECHLDCDGKIVQRVGFTLVVRGIHP